MDDGPVENPQSKAGFLSLLTFSWMNGILKVGSKQPLEEKHLFPIESSNQAERLVGDLEREWLAEERASQQSRTKPRLWRAMMRVISYRDYATMATHRVFYSLTNSCLPLMVWFFLRSLSSGSEISYAATLPFVIGIALISTARSIFLGQWVFKVEVMTIRLKVALIGLVYKKILAMTRRALEDVSSGNIINLVSNDAKAIEQLGIKIGFLSFSLLDIIVPMAVIWIVVAWQALIGACFFLGVSAFGAFTARKAAKWRRKAADQIDRRLEVMKEIVVGIRTVKMYAWEWNFKELVASIRRKELFFIRLRGFIISSIYALFFTSTAIAGFISIIGLLLVGIPVKSFQVFTLLSALANLRLAVTLFIGETLPFIADAKTACERMQRLIQNKCIAPSTVHYKESPSSLPVYFRGRKYKHQPVSFESFRSGKPTLTAARKLEKTPQNNSSEVLLEKAWCYWNENIECPTLKNVSLVAYNGQLIGVTGPVGSGKTSLLMGILGELPVSTGKVSCTGKIAYVSQTSWAFSGTLKENILFGGSFDESRYKQVINVCDLERDFASFPKRDLTEIGQRGVILSGGQRARVSLARAIYSDADVYLLDDPLSAVDAKVGKHLFDKCIREFLAGRVRILVTHQLQFLKQTDYIIMLDNGVVVYEGTYSEIKRAKPDSPRQLNNAEQLQNTNKYTFQHDIQEPEEETAKSICYRERLDLKEEEEDRMVGSVKWQLYWDYFRAALPISLLGGLALFFVIVQVLWIAPYWWLSRMTEMTYEQQKNFVTLLVYGSIVTISLLVTVASSFCFYLAAVKASENLHDEMTKAVIQAPVLFFDTNPVGRILNRFSKDIGCMDDLLPAQFLFTVQLLMHVFSANVLSAIANVWLFITCVPLTFLFIYLAKYYLKSSREIRRLEALMCSPVYSCIADTVAGLEVIRSSKMEDEFLHKLYRYLDKNTAALITLRASTRWLSIRGEALSNFLLTSVSAGALFATQSPALAGMSLAFAIETSEVSQFAIRMASETENHMTSVERVMNYASIEPDPGYSTDALPPEQWPSEGSLTLQDVSLTYLQDVPKVLKNISFSVAPKEKVGVAGRTGAGKSSLVAALFRMPEPEGKILVDGFNIRDLNLQASRRSMVVIPQDPVLFSGSLRRNLDPFSLYEDHDLWSALEEVQLKTLVQQLPDQLEYKLRESGSNFSVGERQLVCLARALLQKSKIIILDEATANVDYKTDRLIQDVIRNRFKDSTVLTIAHRLNTIMDYDKVLVMDQGRVVEFDKPEVLLQNDNGYFHCLVQTQNVTKAH